MLSQREKVFELLRQKLTKAQARMKEVADKHRRELEFAVGDWVLVKLRPRRQTSVSDTTYSKLTKRYYGPFQVTARMGKVAYQLQLPTQSRIHNVFHISLLKPYVAREPPQASTELPPAAIDNDSVVAPLAIIASKLVPSNSGHTRMVLVQWKDLPLEEASWEEWSSFKALHHLGDKVLFEEEGSVTSGNEGVQEVNSQQNGERPRRKTKPPTYMEDYV